MPLPALLLPIALLTLLTACSSLEARDQAPLDPRQAINGTCPRSGKPIAADSLTAYRGQVVGFCNPHCRDDFAAHVDDRPEDRDFFDRLLAKR